MPRPFSLRERDSVRGNLRASVTGWRQRCRSPRGDGPVAVGGELTLTPTLSLAVQGHPCRAVPTRPGYCICVRPTRGRRHGLSHHSLNSPMCSVCKMVCKAPGNEPGRFRTDGIRIESRGEPPPLRAGVCHPNRVWPTHRAKSSVEIDGRPPSWLSMWLSAQGRGFLVDAGAGVASSSTKSTATGATRSNALVGSLGPQCRTSNSHGCTGSAKR